MRTKKINEVKVWEVLSYLQVIINEDKDKEKILNNLEKNILGISGISVNDIILPKDGKIGKINLDYESENYIINFEFGDVEIVDEFFNEDYYFKPDEVEKISKLSSTLDIIMDLGNNPRKAYQLQLKIALSLVPNLVGIFDLSAERLLPFSLIKIVADSKVIPYPDILYSIKDCYSKDDRKCWLYTKGLIRCGITDLEIIDINSDMVSCYSKIIESYANTAVQIGCLGEEFFSAAMSVIKFSDGKEIITACKMWPFGVEEYNQNAFGGIRYREILNNTRTSIIFAYRSEEDVNNQRMVKVTAFGKKLANDYDIQFFTTNEEYKLMKKRILETLDLAINNSNEHFTLIVEIPIDENCVLLADVIESNKNKIRCKIEGENNSFWMKKKDISNWFLKSEYFKIDSNNAYLLM